MEDYQKYLDIAKQKLKIADHMLTVTYPLVRDTKILFVSLENIFLSMLNSMNAILNYERLYKRIPIYNEKSFESKYFMFTNYCQNRHKLDNAYARNIKEIKKIIIDKKKSPVEFQRRDKFVICSEKYETTIITFSKIKEHLDKAKLFILEAASIISKNGRNDA